MNTVVGFDDDLAGEVTRVENCMRGLLARIHPPIERAEQPWLTAVRTRDREEHYGAGSSFITSVTK